MTNLDERRRDNNPPPNNRLTPIFQELLALKDLLAFPPESLSPPSLPSLPFFQFPFIFHFSNHVTTFSLRYIGLSPAVPNSKRAKWNDGAREKKGRERIKLYS